MYKCTYILDNVFYTNKDSLDLDISNSIRTYLSGNKVYPAKSFDLQKLPMKKVGIADGEAEVSCLHSKRTRFTMQKESF